MNQSNNNPLKAPGRGEEKKEMENKNQSTPVFTYLYYVLTDDKGITKRDITTFDLTFITDRSLFDAGNNQVGSTINSIDKINSIEDMKNSIKTNYPGIEFAFCHVLRFTPNGKGFYIATRIKKGEESFIEMLNTERDKVKIDGLIKDISPYFLKIDEIRPELIKYFDNESLSSYLKDTLIKNQKEINRSITNFFHRTFMTLEPTEETPAPARNKALQELPIKPRLISLDQSPLTAELLSFKPEEFKPGGIPAHQTARHEYKGEYRKGKGNAKKKTPVKNAVELHKQTDIIDFSDIKEYVDIDVDKLNSMIKSKTVLTADDMEVNNGISTCINYYLHCFPDRVYKDQCSIPLTFDNIAQAMGYSKATPAVTNQIVVALAKFDRIRITNQWENEAKALGIDINESVDLYGQTVLYDKSPKLLNYDPAIIGTEKTQKRRRNKSSNELEIYDGKPGIIVNQIPPLNIYHKLTNQTITFPIEWRDIPKTGTSKELKRIKRQLCYRLKNCLFYMDKHKSLSKNDGRDYNPNHGNKNKIVIDNLLTETGGYDLTPYEEGDYITVKDPKTKEEITRPATKKDVKKREQTIRVTRHRAITQILKYLKELQKIEPRLKKVKVEDQDGRENSYEYAIRLIVG